MEDRPVRVLYLMPNFGVGGAERSLLVIAEHAASAGIEMHVASIGPPRVPTESTVLPELAAAGIPTHDLGVVGRASQSLVALTRAAARLRHLVNRHEVQIVDSCLFEADLASRLALVGSPVRHVVHHVNTTYSPVVRERIQLRADWRFEATRIIDALTSRLTDGFVAITEAVAKENTRALHLPSERVVVISRGVDLDLFESQPLYTGAFSADRPMRVVAVGRLVPQKDHATLIKAIACARDCGVPVTLEIYGEGPLEVELRSLCLLLELDEGAVVLAGTTNDIAGVLASSDVFAFPSQWEGQGNALIEAMAIGRPILASSISSLREVLGSRGTLAPPGDVPAWASQLTRLANRSASEREADAASLRRRVEENYDAREMVVRLGSHYRGVLQR